MALHRLDLNDKSKEKKKDKNSRSVFRWVEITKKKKTKEIIYILLKVVTQFRFITVKLILIHAIQ